MKRVISFIFLLFLSSSLMASNSNTQTFTIGELIKYKSINRDCEINGYNNSLCDSAKIADAYLIGYFDSNTILYDVCDVKVFKSYTQVDCKKFKYCWPSNMSKNDFFKIASAFAYDNFKDWKNQPAYLVFNLTLEYALKCK